MFRITTRATADELVMKLEGSLEGPWVHELRSYWLGVALVSHGRPLCVDLTDVYHVDRAGRELMAEMFHAGVRFIAGGCEMPELVREISESVRN